MTKLTEEQELAATKEGCNIIVSAGAGSGKTTVLKERVLRKLKKGTNVNELIILTFTKNAASEMKERIRKVIRENESVKSQNELIDSAYITTFDSFANSLVKKYNYLLNIDKSFKIVNSSIVKIELKHIIDEIFEEYYASDDKKFKGMIKNLCVKNDNPIRKSILNLYSELTKLLDRTSFLNTYIDTFYDEKYIDKVLQEYEDKVFAIRDEIIDLLDRIDDLTIDEDTRIKNQEGTIDFINTSTMDELIGFQISIVAYHPTKYDEEFKEVRKTLTSKIYTLKDMTSENKSMLKKHYLSTKNFAEVIIEILLKLDERIMNFKREHNSYEFNDIAALAIKLVRDYEDVREEIKYHTHEIMIDEYQDTSDIQETFISYIQNDNVYMVGDIKQSIYRFRNANPYIFKTKYDNYREDRGGFKIDLNKNFRSREEVINNINLIFDNIMHDRIGGAKYKEEHEMIYGNKTYDENKLNSNYNMEILSYTNEDEKYKDDVIEAFIIADDILKRITAKEQVVYYENDVMKHRDISFDDFVILVNKSNNFELLKKVLESKNIHCVIDKDLDIREDDEIYILNNIIRLLISIHDNNLDEIFKHSFMSVARSYVCHMSDDELFDIITNKTFKETELYQKCLEIANRLDGLSNKDVITNIIDEFDILDMTYTVGDVENRMAKLENFLNDAENLNDFGMNIYDLNDYFSTIMNDKESIKMPSNANIANTVKIMTIHNSKGLEYNYVYLPYLGSNFQRGASKDMISLSNKYGLIIPFYDNGIGSIFTKQLNNQYNRIEELSERIRLFYVALTRAKEKIIMINKFNDKITSTKISSDANELESITSYKDILSLIKDTLNPYIREIDLSTIDINDDYNMIKSYNYDAFIDDSKDILEVKELNLVNTLVEDKHFSKALTSIIDEELKSKLDFGTYMHYIFEVYDFKNDNMKDLDLTEEEKNHLTNFLKHEELKDIKEANIYKEFEIRYQDDESIYHGFIDLLIEYKDYFMIIDYKLSNIDSKEYRVQLNGYKKYIENKYNKPTYIYLYSIMQDKLEKID